MVLFLGRVTGLTFPEKQYQSKIMLQVRYTLIHTCIKITSTDRDLI